jgi:hypothetical protein
MITMPDVLQGRGEPCTSRQLFPATRRQELGRTTLAELAPTRAGTCLIPSQHCAYNRPFDRQPGPRASQVAAFRADAGHQWRALASRPRARGGGTPLRNIATKK